MRRLPVYLLLDTSGSMNGEPIQALNNALSGMISNLRSDPMAVETLWISIVTFDKVVKEVLPLTDLPSYNVREIVCPESGPTLTGKGLEYIYEKVKTDVRRGTDAQQGDWRPLLFVFTDGTPNDMMLYREMIPKIKSLNFASIVGCAAGKLSNNEVLKELCDVVIHLDVADSATLKSFFKWVSETIEQGNKSMGTTDHLELPPPPDEIHFVI